MILGFLFYKGIGIDKQGADGVVEIAGQVHLEVEKPLLLTGAIDGKGGEAAQHQDRKDKEKNQVGLAGGAFALFGPQEVGAGVLGFGECIEIVILVGTNGIIGRVPEQPGLAEGLVGIGIFAFARKQAAIVYQQKSRV